MLIGHDAYMEDEKQRSQRLLALLGGLCSLDLFSTAELRKRRSLETNKEPTFEDRITFFARFLRSFRSFREGFSTFLASPD